MIPPATFKRFAADPGEFRGSLWVDVSGQPRRFADVADPWQLADFEAMDGGLQRCNGCKPDAEGPGRGFLERPRGHSKTSDIAMGVVWALAFARRPIRAFAFASDRDQAKLLRDAVHTLIRLNGWLSGLLEVESHRVVNVGQDHPGQGGTLAIESSDVSSSFGINPDMVVCDELSHWQGDGSLWESVVSSAAKRSCSLLLTITNAGWRDSWAWRAREAVRSDPSWYFSRLDGPVASWITPAVLEGQRRLLPPASFARLWLNEWATGGGDALEESLIDFAFKPDLKPQYYGVPTWDYCGGVDIGVSRDASAVCILGVVRGREGYGRIRLAHSQTWRPRRGEKVDLMKVETALRDLHQRFDLRRFNYDSWQCEHLAGRLRAGGRERWSDDTDAWTVPMFEVHPSPQNLQKIASTLIEAFNDRRLELYEDADLRRELKRLRVVEKNYGFRLESPRDEYGHGDLATAFSLALLAAGELARRPKIIASAL